MTTNNFFVNQTEQSKIKSIIVSKYFYAWAKILGNNNHINSLRYIDLFSGTGVYDDGSLSTPLLILNKAIDDDVIRDKILIKFNDINQKSINSLKASANKIEDYQLIAPKVEYFCLNINSDVSTILTNLGNGQPILLFIDPFGYKSLTLDLINSVLQYKRSEVIFYFNYRRINAAISNEFMTGSIDALFSSDRADSLRRILSKLSHPQEREAVIIENIIEALKSDYANHVLTYRFWNDNFSRINHHLIFATKHPLGYTVMKDIMAKQSYKNADEIPTFEYRPNSQIDFDAGDTINKLKSQLLLEFTGKQLIFNDVFKQHHLDKPFTRSNYKTAMLELEEDGKVQIQRPSVKSPKHTISDKSLITFS